MSHVIAALVQQHFFGRSQPSVHCLIGHGGAAERTRQWSNLFKQKRALLSKIRLCKHNQAQTNIPKSDKAHAPNSNADREEKQPEGCEKDPKSTEESEEKPPEGCNKDPKPVTHQPGAAQLWLAGLKTMEEGEKNNHNTSNTTK